MTEAAASPAMTREQFLRSVGLTPDDVYPPGEEPTHSSPYVPRYSSNHSSPDKKKAATPEAEHNNNNNGGGALLPHASTQDEDILFKRGPNDEPMLVHDDEWIRKAQFADVLVLVEDEKSSASDIKKNLVESYRQTQSSGSSGNGTYVASADVQDDRKATEMVTEEDHAVAADYRASMLEEFRKRKARGEVKPVAVSPSRARVTQQDEEL